ncbi:MAG: type VI secretion system baseplate subunit TssE [Candidatus Tectimicrobiota bacterium]
MASRTAYDPGYTRALLFDRLVDMAPREPVEAQPRKTFTRAALRESVRRELEGLLNTRCPVGTPERDPRARSVIDYGLPDCAQFSPESEADQQRLAQLLGETITAFEPRLRQVRVTVEAFQEQQKTLQVRIEAVLVVDAIIEPITFMVLAQHDQGVFQVHAHA